MAVNAAEQRTFRHLPGYFNARQQAELLLHIKDILEIAPLFQPVMPRTGKAFSVRMSNCGPLGWVSDKERGYRYQPTHPVTEEAWPAMPKLLLDLWLREARYPAPPEACLINLYQEGAKMGAHQDRDEADFSAPVVSVSLGDAAVFHVGGRKRTDPKVRVTLKSGDVLLLEGESRLAYHGIDRVIAGSSELLARCGFAEGGRMNLTLRRVTGVG
ncbi:MAG: alpha-ketoglutarate-dependent dioxygenase AlkB [Hyphomicrobiaceae bacterium]|nr:alpha-ketoglutarate-dependent dioxygenase AlkB [Hyphomicrobiaceae bacterium]